MLALQLLDHHLAIGVDQHDEAEGFLLAVQHPRDEDNGAPARRHELVVPALEEAAAPAPAGRPRLYREIVLSLYRVARRLE